MIPPIEIQKRAVDDCLEHVGGLLDGEYIAIPSEPDVEWDAFDQRHVLNQSLELFRRYSSFEVYLDERNTVVGFYDPSEWEDCTWEIIPYQEVLEILRSSVLDLPKIIVETIDRGERESMDVYVHHRLLNGDVVRWFAQINPSRKTIISIKPVVPNND